MVSLIQELVGKRVRLWSGRGENSYADDGVLDACDGEWLRLDKNGEKLYFPLYNVRLIKPIEPLDDTSR
jgi:hypothetical protein